MIRTQFKYIEGLSLTSLTNYPYCITSIHKTPFPVRV